MPADKPRPTLADYVTIAVSPALIMALIVSLVFFVLAVLYRGEFVSRLHTILFFFIFGIVLVGRIAMETGYAERAPIYGGVLAALVWLGMRNYVSYPDEVVAPGLVNAGLIVLAWWLSFQLTHSCTYIDERAESTGTGLVDAAGLEQPLVPPAAPPAGDQPPPREGKRGKTRQPSWWYRYRQFREKRSKTQPAGVWVVYFALAALPIFGLGQALIDVGDRERRAYTFWLMALYLASSLGLLITTAFLGLRRYLRQRGLEMPKTVTAAWLVVGSALLVSLVVIGALLPRPQSEFSLLDLGHGDAKKLAASKYAVTPGEPGKDKGRPGAQENDPDGAPSSGKGSGGKGKDDKDNSASSKATQKSDGAAKKTGADRDTEAKQDKQSADQSENRDPSEQSATSPEDPGGSSFLKDLFADLSKLLKWVIFGIVAAVALLLVLGSGLRYLANFTDWARRLLEALRRFWEGLFRAQDGRGASANGVCLPPQPRCSPFHAFTNPFHDGRAEVMSAAELVRYSFEALEAWALESDCERAAQETSIEFASRLAGEVGALGRETKDLGTLYACVLYARGKLPANWRETLEDFWMRLAALPVRRGAAQEA